MTGSAIIKDSYDEAAILALYLVGEQPGKEVRRLYEIATSEVADMDTEDQALLRYIYRHPSSLSFIDAGLALLKPASEVRRRLYVMLSILEATPRYADKFLSKPQSWWYVFVAAFLGVRAICKALIGILLVKVVGR